MLSINYIYSLNYKQNTMGKLQFILLKHFAFRNSYGSITLLAIFLLLIYLINNYNYCSYNTTSSTKMYQTNLPVYADRRKLSPCP